MIEMPGIQLIQFIDHTAYALRVIQKYFNTEILYR